VKGIAKWRLAGGKGVGGSPRRWGKWVKRGKLRPMSPFIGKEREREEVTVVPHVGVRTPAACQTGWTTPRCQAPIPGL
jgi:hypothetical protein